MIRRTLQLGMLATFVQLAACGSGADAPVAEPRVDANAAAPADKAIAPTGDERLVVAFGDSLYAGYNLDSDEGFAPVLERALEQRGIAADVRNAGVSGDTTAAGRARLAFTLDGLPRKPDLVVLGLGGNDMLRGLAPSETRANLDAMMAELQRREIPVVLTGMIASPNMGGDYMRDFNAIFPELAEQYQAPLYPFFLDGVILNAGLMLPDGIHPNAQGVKRVVERVAPVVAGALTPGS